MSGGQLTVNVPQTERLSKVFDAMESLRSGGKIQDYSVSQCTLEQVFLLMARQQDTE